MYEAYVHKRRNSRASAQQFIVEYAFLKATTPDVSAFARSFLSGFTTGDGAIRTQMLCIALEPEIGSYSYLKDPLNLFEKWNIDLDMDEDDLLHYDGRSINFERIGFRIGYLFRIIV